jgi:TatD DNase family protein
MDKGFDFKTVFDFKTLFDSHSHFNSIQAPMDEIIKDSLGACVEKIIDVATDIKSSQKALQNASFFPDIILPTAGIHPEWLVPGSEMYGSSRDEESVEVEMQKLRDLIKNNPSKFFMVGETGLDYYWLEKNTALSKTELEKSKSLQKQLFESQLKIALEFDLPVTIHARESHKDCIEIVSKYSGKLRAIFHSFTGNIEEAKEIMWLGFPIGINGIVTYKSAQTLRATLNELTKSSEIASPYDLYDLGIYLESDSPLLIPSNIENRKKYNSPDSIKFIWEFVYNLLNQ